MVRAKFAIGQVVTHALYGYQGAIIDADPVFSLSPEWYERMAQTRPAKNQPWYHILVNNSDIQTYVAEHSLIAEHRDIEISNPKIDSFFRNPEQQKYQTQETIN